jgi:iron complex transport system ATP-binding protein
MNHIIELDNICFSYSQNTVLKNISFKIKSGTFLAVIGPNGAGKTTLLNLLCGLLTPQSGFIKVYDADVKSYSPGKLARKIAVVRQEFVPVFDFTVEEVVTMARIPYLGTFGFEGKSDREIVAEALEITDISPFASRPLAHLSGGERQRVFIARAIAQNTPLLLLDEPTSFLDIKYQVGIYDLLRKMQLEKGKTIIAVTHDINLASQYCDQVLLLGADSSCYIGKPDEVFSRETIEKIFGVKIAAGKIQQQNFFIPLGKFAKNIAPPLSDTDSTK